MKEYKRVFVIVIDSLGIGVMPDGEKFGDIGGKYPWTYSRVCGDFPDPHTAEAGDGESEPPLKQGARCRKSPWLPGCPERTEQRERHHDRPLGDHGN